MKLKARWVVDRNLHVISNGSVNTRAGKGELHFGESILMPGLVNAHCHLDYTHMKGRVPARPSFTDWIQDISRVKSSWVNQDYIKSIQSGLEQSLKFGTTTLVNWICSPEWISGPHRLTPRVWWLWEQITFKKGNSKEDWEDWVGKVELGSPLWKAGLAPHAPYTCPHPDLQAMADWSRMKDLPWSIHVAESEDESLMFQEAKGPLYERMQFWNRDMSDCGQGTSCQGTWDALRRQGGGGRVLLVHGNHLAESDLVKMQHLIKLGVRLVVVHCPRSHRFFSRKPLALDSIRAAGIPVALGTDSLASNEDLSMFGEMREMRRAHPELNSKEVVGMSTHSALDVLGAVEDWNGWGDWIAIPCGSGTREHDVWDHIVQFSDAPHFVMVNGVVHHSLG